ncbi:hypothetical protein BMW23_0791 [Bodo saltans virus]|uniref:Uncharacterized protein n=1 Tax=Bodo saltans virus TaxID=2024608 RepID=A0A2H4UVE7_9VIRU|nr:hypothetical protein QJ851_gp0774 [Bodo saltans virus]ATZ80837.1 hypothetical protein BMW23_0791 [Bodo saltans virus]
MQCQYCDCTRNIEIYDGIQLCILCYISSSSSSSSSNIKYINTCIVGHSDYSQNNINKRTNEYYDKNGYIPFPHEIEEDFKIIDINSYFYLLFDTKIKNLKIFFTGEVEKYMENEVEKEFRISKKKPLIIYYKYDRYILSNDENELITKNMNVVKMQNTMLMKDIHDSLTQKYSYL